MKCRENGDLAVQYVDLNSIEARDEEKRQVTSPQFILIETGFTASANKFMEFGREFQLEEDIFFNIWKESLRIHFIEKRQGEQELL